MHYAVYQVKILVLSLIIYLIFNLSMFLHFRVRIEVLRALASRVTSSQQLSYCLSNGPRPKLSIGPAVGYPGKRTSFFYTDAIKKFGHLLDDRFLEKEYDRAKMFFPGKYLIRL